MIQMNSQRRNTEGKVWNIGLSTGISLPKELVCATLLAHRCVYQHRNPQNPGLLEFLEASSNSHDQFLAPLSFWEDGVGLKVLRF